MFFKDEGLEDRIFVTSAMGSMLEKLDTGHAGATSSQKYSGERIPENIASISTGLTALIMPGHTVVFFATRLQACTTT